MEQPNKANEIAMDISLLCREDTFTDNRVGTIRRLTPVTETGEVDHSRDIRFVGSTQIMTPAGALPLSFEIPADDLKAAAEGFGAAAQIAVERTMEELKEMQRQAASSIVVPKGGMGPGDIGGQGGIQLP